MGACEHAREHLCPLHQYEDDRIANLDNRVGLSRPAFCQTGHDGAAQSTSVRSTLATQLDRITRLPAASCQQLRV